MYNLFVPFKCLRDALVMLATLLDVWKVNVQRYDSKTSVRLHALRRVSHHWPPASSKWRPAKRMTMAWP